MPSDPCAHAVKRLTIENLQLSILGQLRVFLWSQRLVWRLTKISGRHHAVFFGGKHTEHTLLIRAKRLVRQRSCRKMVYVFKMPCLNPRKERAGHEKTTTKAQNDEGTKKRKFRVFSLPYFVAFVL
jgi:hypothetical protein